METLSREFRVALLWEMLYADDLVVTDETEDDLIKRFNKWKDKVENRGMRVNINTSSPAVARMTDRTAPVVKLTLTLTQILPGARE